MPEYFYHIKPEIIISKELLPLSSLEETAPKIANKIIKSYGARKNILNKKVDLLDCTWRDVIFLSCLNPEVIYAALEMLGLDKELSTILRFPVSVLKGKNVCLYQEEKGKEKFATFSLPRYKETETIPVETLQYFLNCAKKGVDPLVFSGVPHILLNGKLDIADAETIEYRSLIK